MSKKYRNRCRGIDKEEEVDEVNEEEEIDEVTESHAKMIVTRRKGIRLRRPVSVYHRCGHAMVILLT